MTLRPISRAHFGDDVGETIRPADNASASPINALQGHVDLNDKLLIFEVKRDEWYAQGLDDSAMLWLMQSFIAGAAQGAAPATSEGGPTAEH
ncbi:MAG: hypothetical protein E6J90_36705 [Deltaproteobacteria bacterium]|nr:MAG: hypothetical protein E6J91_48430 [Deltaproteobacteria bacterium]TMQ10182.1 MAG: hypothetical protein E6J90_36705 [Deltaproteobacteria bacterium]